jgi:hypothetical protein
MSTGMRVAARSQTAVEARAARAEARAARAAALNGKDALVNKAGTAAINAGVSNDASRSGTPLHLRGISVDPIMPTDDQFDGNDASLKDQESYEKAYADTYPHTQAPVTPIVIPPAIPASTGNPATVFGPGPHTKLDGLDDLPAPVKVQKKSVFTRMSDTFKAALASLLAFLTKHFPGIFKAKVIQG